MTPHRAEPQQEPQAEQESKDSLVQPHQGGEEVNPNQPLRERAEAPLKAALEADEKRQAGV